MRRGDRLLLEERNQIDVDDELQLLLFELRWRGVGNEAEDVERLEDVVKVSRTSWTRVRTSWKPRGSIGAVVWA